ncbi:MAG: hypothetical protein AAGE59_00255 [Cyanobacteria bacterium P01_F01_bin.86]
MVESTTAESSFLARILWGIFIGMAIALVMTSFPSITQARSCYSSQGHEICLERIQRSAKYHWQYKVKASVDGKSQPLMRYNCRVRLKTPLEGPNKGFPTDFEPEGIGDRICKLVNR